MVKKKKIELEPEIKEPTNWEKFLKFARNGGKAQITAGFIALVALILFLAQLVTGISSQKYHPLSNYETPFPAVYLDGVLSIDTKLCASHNVRITNNASLTLVDNDDSAKIITAATLPFDKKKGCDRVQRVFFLPGLNPGNYKIIGTDTVTNGDKTQEVPWESTIFNVK